MIKPIKGTFKSFHDYIKTKGHNEKELDPNQIHNIPTEEKILYLTFDTCPTHEVDFEVVNWLVKNKIPATIFLNIEWYKNNETKDLSFLKSDQFSIGGHGFAHKRPSRQDLREQTYDIDSCVNFIQNELKREIKWYRCPYGKPNEDTINILNGLGLKFASWAGHVFDKTEPDLPNPNILSMDYIKDYTIKGDIWLFHINKEGINTFEILQQAYKWAIDNGYRFEKM
jgi:peptidoglycan/xylan/chitin deacetylase (PgdA/CDA1 family)